MDVTLYIFVFLASLLVDVIPLIGPPAWLVMVFFQVKYGLNIWLVLVVGVTGSAIGRYLYSCYVFYFANHFIKPQKNEDMQFIGKKLTDNGLKVYFFVFLYTLMPLPSTPLFTAAGIARMKIVYLIPSFFAGKFISDSIMVFAGDYAAHNVGRITLGLLSWQNIAGAILGLLIICIFLFIDWRKLLEEKKFSLHFNIWK
ncbi:hypothetical protein FRZ67_04555 [Panacibacter ginsenosidivorans]|uniref:DedA family protein n=1 Tax=Panacibacter ginsenosidivorans TaxID=1813871 RepID=A0A5B8V6T6_9BACT|nr:hypothetical protein [Panacibacter ginsenosidivorans]QEC66603.1 hypothetical protein FRZ67_04555 [Panacibacter ginsenosidivorans]